MEQVGTNRINTGDVRFSIAKNLPLRGHDTDPRGMAHRLYSCKSFSSPT